jgi:hypothetical protein
VLHFTTGTKDIKSLLVLSQGSGDGQDGLCSSVQNYEQVGGKKKNFFLLIYSGVLYIREYAFFFFYFWHCQL